MTFFYICYIFMELENREEQTGKETPGQNSVLIATLLVLCCVF